MTFNSLNILFIQSGSRINANKASELLAKISQVRISISLTLSLGKIRLDLMLPIVIFKVAVYPQDIVIRNVANGCFEIKEIEIKQRQTGVVRNLIETVIIPMCLGSMSSQWQR